MEYTVGKLATLSGISQRTLRYYDQIGLLSPRRIDASGYRIYGPQDVARLQQILLYRGLDVPLEEIGRILDAPDFDLATALRRHEQSLLARQAQVEALLTNVRRTLDDLKGEISMKDEQRFEGLKDQMIRENEEKYGVEVRQRWGDAAADQSNAQLQGMTQAQFDAQQTLGAAVNTALAAAVEEGDPRGPRARQTVELHRQWLSGWGHYPPEAHMGLAQMYVDDPRFAEYYEKAAPGAAAFLRDAVVAYYEK